MSVQEDTSELGMELGPEPMLLGPVSGSLHHCIPESGHQEGDTFAKICLGAQS